MPSRSGPPSAAGRWSRLPGREADATRRAHAQAEVLLDRHGVVTRGAVVAERTPGGFAAVYPVLRASEESGRARRGYFVESLGAAQFATPGAVDRLRTYATDRFGPPTDPRGPDPAALTGPGGSGSSGGTGAGGPASRAAVRAGPASRAAVRVGRRAERRCGLGQRIRSERGVRRAGCARRAGAARAGARGGARRDRSRPAVRRGAAVAGSTVRRGR